MKGFEAPNPAGAGGGGRGTAGAAGAVVAPAASWAEPFLGGASEAGSGTEILIVERDSSESGTVMRMVVREVSPSGTSIRMVVRESESGRSIRAVDRGSELSGTLMRIVWREISSSGSCAAPGSMRIVSRFKPGWLICEGRLIRMVSFLDSPIRTVSFLAANGGCGRVMRMVSFFDSPPPAAGFGGRVIRTVAFLERDGSGMAGGFSSGIDDEGCISPRGESVNNCVKLMTKICAGRENSIGKRARCGTHELLLARFFHPP